MLVFHGVEYVIEDQRLQYLQTPYHLFEGQMALIRDNFEVISIERLRQHLDTDFAEVDRPMCVLTFDDGYKNNRCVVAPLLKELGLPFTVFVSTRHVSEGDFFPAFILRFAVYLNPYGRLAVDSLRRTFPLKGQEAREQTHKELKAILKNVPQPRVREIIADLRNALPPDLWPELRSRFQSLLPLSWREAAEIVDLGGTIGSHCHEHAILHDRQSNEEIQFQLATSKSLLEQHLGSADYFAFPNGRPEDMSPAALSALGACGYRLAFSAIRGSVTARAHQYMLPRISGDGRPGSELESELWRHLG